MSDFVETNYEEGGDTDFMSGSMDTPTTTFQGKKGLDYQFLISAS